MKRFSGHLAITLTLVLCPLAAAQSSSQKSLADRLGSLREGWSFSSDKEADAKRPLTTPERVALRGKEPQKVAEVTDSPRSFPRVNPRELMPRNWFGVNTKQNNPPAKPAPTKKPSVSKPKPSAGSVGSAQARLLRDMRRAPAVEPSAAVNPTPRLAQRAQPRAGSVLSPGAPVLTPSTSQSSAYNSRLARSIAADVAEAMDQTPAVADTQATVAPEQPIEAEAVVDAVVENEEPSYASNESLLPFGGIEGTTPTEEADEPVAAIEPQEAVAEPAYAENESGRVSVAARTKQPTKLPLFIGDRYGERAEPTETTIEPAQPEVESDPAAEAAFADGPRAATPVATPKVVIEADDDLLFTQRMPVLVSRVGGPRTIVVGREASYRVVLANRGDVAADQVVTRVTIPAWAEVVSSRAEAGQVDQNASLAEEGDLVWRCDRLAAGDETRLDLKLVARSGKPISLGVTHTHQPIDGETLVEVQEPKLALSLVGPEEVLYGKPQIFRLTISNPGTGAAEQVKLLLTPPGGKAERQTSHDFGSINAGEERSVEIELTAREAGDLAVSASATADGNVTADVSKQVFCRKPELVVDWRGPKDRYAGAPAVYYFRVRNPGTAVAPNVVLKVDLPTGFEVIPGADTPKEQDGKLAFRAGSLRPGDDKYFELRGVLRQAGANDIVLRAAADDETRSESLTATTEVVALADLKLDVLDPKGPIATGQEVEYEIRITNRGSNDALDIRTVGLFSAGVEPHHIEGSGAQMHDGRVAFEAIDALAAGESVVFKIHARAHEAGTHRFRAEVLCRDLEIKLAAEETTRFFEDEAISVADGYPSDSTNPLYPR